MPEEVPEEHHRKLLRKANNISILEETDSKFVMVVALLPLQVSL